MILNGNRINITDNDASSISIGSEGRSDLLSLKTVNDNEAVIVKGTTNVLAFHVDIGDAIFDEDVSIL